MCVGWLLDGGPSDQLTRPRRQAVARERLLDTAVRQFLSERAPPAPRMGDVAMLVAGAVRLRVTGDALVSMGEQVGSVERHDAEGSVHGDSESVRAWYAALGAALAARSTPPAPAIAERELPPEVLEGVRTAATTGDRAHMLAAVVVSWASEHLNLLRRQEDRITQAAARIAQDRPVRN